MTNFDEIIAKAREIKDLENKIDGRSNGVNWINERESENNTYEMECKLRDRIKKFKETFDYDYYRIIEIFKIV